LIDYNPFLPTWIDTMARQPNTTDFTVMGVRTTVAGRAFIIILIWNILYIHAGLNKLTHQKKQEVQSRAALVCRQTEKADEKATPVRLMCPLNSDGLCTLYIYRPMICRLHGIPHELRKPGQNVIRGPGCGMFAAQCSNKSYRKFDRTPFYFEMAKLESELKQAVDLSGRIKMTIAEMIIA
jgi:hypothetical protein